jgi:UDP-N-acetylmuramoyl-tripeptide--D-alanyl-D-alanine ligase
MKQNDEAERMKNLTLRNIAACCGGVLKGDLSSSDFEITAITTDSRTVTDGCLFAAIRGERADGHKFAEQVMENGAACVLSEKDLGWTDRPFIQTASTLEALKAIAEFYLKQLNIPVVGVTGSVGKTSTKEMIASVLKEKYRVLKTDGNFNNELGLPLTVFRLREDDEIAVLEMGISHFGEMHRLAKIARPDTCVITNIGWAHLENLGTRDGILKAKSEIFDFLREDGHIILNGDDDKLASVRVEGHTPVRFGLDPANDLYADAIVPHGFEGTSCRIHTKKGSFDAMIRIPGSHMVYNALAGAAVGLVYGLTNEEIRRGIESCRTLAGRFNIIRTDRFTVIDDCYNANPASMKASLAVLQSGSGRKVALLGDMGELGADEIRLHEEVGEAAGRMKIDALFCAGPLSARIADGAEKTGSGKMEIRRFASREELTGRLPELLQNGDTILVKASHSMQFDKIVEALRRM